MADCKARIFDAGVRFLYLAPSNPNHSESHRMEYGRFKEINDLKTQGWKEDEETHAIYANEPARLCGGPTYLKDPQGVIHAVSCGTTTVLNDHGYKDGIKIPS